jgi:hypothetical protein
VSPIAHSDSDRHAPRAAPRRAWRQRRGRSGSGHVSRRAIRIRSRRGTRWHRARSEPCCPPRGRSTRCTRRVRDGIASRSAQGLRSVRSGAQQRVRCGSPYCGRSGWLRPPPGVPERRLMTGTTARLRWRLLAPRAETLRRRQGRYVSRSATVSDRRRTAASPPPTVRPLDSPLLVARSDSELAGLSVSLFYDNASTWTQCSVVNASLDSRRAARTGRRPNVISRGIGSPERSPQCSVRTKRRCALAAGTASRGPRTLTCAPRQV